MFYLLQDDYLYVLLAPQCLQNIKLLRISINHLRRHRGCFATTLCGFGAVNFVLHQAGKPSDDSWKSDARMERLLKERRISQHITRTIRTLLLFFFFSLSLSLFVLKSYACGIANDIVL